MISPLRIGWRMYVYTDVFTYMFVLIFVCVHIYIHTHNKYTYTWTYTHDIPSRIIRMIGPLRIG
jgi:hypothetical protein